VHQRVGGPCGCWQVTSKDSLCGFFAEEVPLQVMHPVLPFVGAPDEFVEAEDIPVFVCGRLGVRSTSVLDFAFLSSYFAPLDSPPHCISVVKLVPLLQAFMNAVSSTHGVVPTVQLGVAVAALLLQRPLPEPLGRDMTVDEAVRSQVVDTYLQENERRTLKPDEVASTLALPQEDIVGILRGTLDLTGGAVRECQLVGASDCGKSGGACVPRVYLRRSLGARGGCVLVEPWYLAPLLHPALFPPAFLLGPAPASVHLPERHHGGPSGGQGRGGRRSRCGYLAPAASQLRGAPLWGASRRWRAVAGGVPPPASAHDATPAWHLRRHRCPPAGPDLGV
jgi:hypothetical protein